MKMLPFFLVSLKTTMVRTNTAPFHDDSFYYSLPEIQIDEHSVIVALFFRATHRWQKTHTKLIIFSSIQNIILFAPSVNHKRTKICAKKAFTRGNILLSLLALGRSSEKIQKLSHGKDVTSSPLKRGADVRFVKLQSCSLDEILIQPIIPASGSDQ